MTDERDWEEMIVLFFVIAAITSFGAKAKGWIDEKVASVSGGGAGEVCQRPVGVDGDTIKATCGDKRVTVRFYGIDTPESKRPGVPIECQAIAASHSMKEMLKGKSSVRLVSDPSQESIDRYGRKLAYVEVDGRDLNRAQLEKGFARVYVYRHKKFKRYKDYRRAERAAQKEDKGIWRYCGGDNHKSGL